MSATTIDHTRTLRDLYGAPREPTLVDVPELAFLMIDGHGDPNTAATYREAIDALYGVSFTMRFAVTAGGGPAYKVMPLESLWWSVDGVGPLAADRSAWSWTAMIMQPPPVTAAAIEAAKATAAARRPLPAVERMRWARLREGRAAQMMYVGPWRDEGPAIARLHAFIAARGLVPTGLHHEIYLGDPRRTAPERLRTIIRQPVSTGSP